MDSFTRGALRFDVTEYGPADGVPVLLLHGFPQTAASWEPVARRLADAGYRVLAPDQRGYSAGARPTGRRAYRVEELVDDVVALADAAGADTVHVVGHDWGAIVAWALAALRPDRVRTLTAVSVPHPAAFMAAMVSSRQLALSWYVYAFQLPALAERFLGRPGGLAAAVRRTGQSAERARRDEAALTAKGGLRPALTGAINWYRATPFWEHRGLRVTVATPTLMVWSDGDSAVSRAAVEGNPRWVTGPYRLEVFPGTSHWIPDEAPDRLADLVLEHVARR
ncbi:alpha/beta fold hydrolase [Actinomycetospora lemnae]|uniref:Alpha/beta fold hydrolase n=1 Tax=Actinomycetospora lemnae TaxID=3019891 RepID=A0ABT5STA9_9PSEU|nr:alpha/beta fold hydrolase [Actinomycetospora sp. DW7H6]MDD7966009.1 alpha/beta fold hydrolase [Actinomycetospora sp. DW7H6]